MIRYGACSCSTVKPGYRKILSSGLAASFRERSCPVNSIIGNVVSISPKHLTLCQRWLVRLCAQSDCFGALRYAPVCSGGDYKGVSAERLKTPLVGGGEPPGFGGVGTPLGSWCGRWELNPHGPYEPCGFSYRLRLSPPAPSRYRRFGGFVVWTIPSPSPGNRRLGAARLVSTPSVKFRSRLGSGSPVQVSPNLSSSASPVSRRALKLS